MPSAIVEAGGSGTGSRASSARLIVVRAVQDDLGAVATRRRHLDEGCPLRHDDDGRRPETRGVEGDGEPVVAGARRDDPAGALRGVELEQEVGGPAVLERARHLEGLELDEAPCAADLRERLRVGAGRLVDGALEALSGAVDRKSTRLNSSHLVISYAVFCLKKKKTSINKSTTSV